MIIMMVLLWHKPCDKKRSVSYTNTMVIKQNTHYDTQSLSTFGLNEVTDWLTVLWYDTVATRWYQSAEDSTHNSKSNLTLSYHFNHQPQTESAGLQQSDPKEVWRGAGCVCEPTGCARSERVKHRPAGVCWGVWGDSHFHHGRLFAAIVCVHDSNR